MEVFSLFGTIGLKGAEAVKSDLDSVTNKAETAGAKSEGAFSKFGNAMKNATPASTALLGGVVAAGVGIGVLAKKSIDLASDLNEVQNVVDVTFGGMSNDINAWSKNALQKYGLSELSAKQFTGTMGAMLKSSGFAGKELETMSTGIAGLSGDFASFYNLKPEEAFEKIRSGISGETEPLKQLGINMSEGNLQAFALAEGLKKPYNKMSEMEKQQVRYKYLMKVSKDSQGDFARTSDSFANQQKLLGETLKGVGASIVKGLLPHLATLMKKVNDFFNGDWQGKLEKLAPVFAMVGGAILVGLVPALVTMAGAALAAVAPLLPFLAVGAALGAIIYLIVQHLGGFSAAWDKLKGAWDKVVQAAQPIIQMFKDTFAKAMEALKPSIDKIKDSFSKFGDVFKVVGVIIGGAVAVILAVVTGLVNGIINAIAGFAQMFSGIVSIIQGVFSLIVGIFTGDGDKIKQAVKAIGQGIVDVFSGLWNAVSGFLKGFVDGVVGFFKGLWDTLVGHSIIPDTINAIVDWFKKLVGLVTAPLTAFSDFVKNGFNAVKDIVSNIFNGIKNAISDKFNAAKDKVSSIVEGIKGLFSGSLNGAVGIVGGVFDKIKDAIGDKINAAKDKVKSAIDKIKDFFHFSWSLPKLKLPHIDISGSFSLNPPKVPKFGIDWYANGGIMNDPTAFGMNGNKLMVGGEAGPEAIAPIGTLRQYVREEVQGVQGNTEALLAELLEFTKAWLPQVANMQMVTDTGALVGAIAPQMDGQLGRIYKSRGRGSV